MSKKDFLFYWIETNVLDRYYKVNQYFNGDIIIRITSDCPLMDPKLIDKFINLFFKKKLIIWLILFQELIQMV